MFLRSTLVLWKTVIFLLPGLDFIPNKISPAGVAKARPLLIPALEAGNWDTRILLTDAQLPHQLKPNPDVKIREFGIVATSLLVVFSEASAAASLRRAARTSKNPPGEF